MTVVALIGFGEVGRTLAEDLHARGEFDLIAWDRLFPQASSLPFRTAVALGYVRRASGMADALRRCDIAISAVTAAQCVHAAAEAAPALPRGAYWLDLNSVSPATKVEAARLVDTAGGRFVEGAVMSPIAPKRIASPMLLGGPHAMSLEPALKALGFDGVQVFSETLGKSSAAKMCRSLIIKGLEALLTESLLAARHHGVESTVLASLRDLFPSADWPALSRYMISRSLQHGRRRAEEMRDVARTVAEAGLSPWMSEACAQRQDWAASHADALAHQELAPLLDAVLGAIAPRDSTEDA